MIEALDMHNLFLVGQAEGRFVVDVFHALLFLIRRWHAIHSVIVSA